MTRVGVTRQCGNVHAIEAVRNVVIRAPVQAEHLVAVEERPGRYTVVNTPRGSHYVCACDLDVEIVGSWDKKTLLSWSTYDHFACFLVERVPSDSTKCR